MARKINLNADMAEGYGVYEIGNDAALISIVRSASVACGFHGGDWMTMHRICALAKANGASVGAHPGFNDLWGFGRRNMQMPPAQVELMTAYQIGALQAVAACAGMKVTHVKVHGALNNMAAADKSLALALGRAIKAVDPSLIFVVIAATEMETAGNELGLRIAREGYADRQYEDNLMLVSRQHAGAVIRDPKAAAEQALRIAAKGEVVTRNGKVVPLEVDTICLHGDEPNAVAVAEAIAARFRAAGIENVPLPEMPLSRSGVV
jgi:5-oxoprolinase (ATP-hydrolysing) subunit A